MYPLENVLNISYLSLIWNVKETHTVVGLLTDEQKEEFKEQLACKCDANTSFTFYDIRLQNGGKKWYRLGWIIGEFAAFFTIQEWLEIFAEKYNSADGLE